MLNVGQFEIDAVSRPCERHHFSGDLAYYREAAGDALVAVVDVAGHGREARDVALQIEEVLEAATNPQDWSDGRLMKRLHRHLQSTRGAVALIGRLLTAPTEFHWSSIGDIHGKLFDTEAQRLNGQAGMLGHHAPEPTVHQTTIGAGQSVVICSDGVSERFDIPSRARLKHHPLEELANRVLDDFRRTYDDSTCLILRHNR